jgi:hypothetical protein
MGGKEVPVRASVREIELAEQRVNLVMGSAGRLAEPFVETDGTGLGMGLS